MEDLDSYLRSEIDSINDMFEEFQTQDERHEKRKKSEELKLQEKVARFLLQCVGEGFEPDFFYTEVLKRQFVASRPLE